jgi:8-oxo-dGTP diphosphatase
MSAAIPVVVCFVIERDRHVLLLRRNAWKDEAPGQWETGSGRVEPGEAPADAARREAREETGLEVEVLGELGAHPFLRGRERVETLSVVLHCRARTDAVVLSTEHDEARWVPIAEAPDLPEVPEWVRRSLEALRRAAARSPRPRRRRPSGDSGRHEGFTRRDEAARSFDRPECLFDFRPGGGPVCLTELIHHEADERRL